MTQSVFDESPRYSVFDVILSKLLKLYVLLSHTGSGAHESREKEARGSQPPKQYAPTPHCPYSINHKVSFGQTRAGLRISLREQHGVSVGHLLSRPQEAWAYTVAAAARAAMNIDVRAIIYMRVDNDTY